MVDWSNAEPEEEDEDFKPDDYIDIHINNRNHVRDLSRVLATVDGLILTGTFGLLYFIINLNFLV